LYVLHIAFVVLTIFASCFVVCSRQAFATWSATNALNYEANSIFQCAGLQFYFSLGYVGLIKKCFNGCQLVFRQPD